MITVLDRLRKRRCYPVPEAGEGIFVRSLTRGELIRLGALEGDDKTDFVIGCVLVTQAGEPVFPKHSDETDAEFCARVKAAFLDVDTETVAQISAAVGRIGKVPPPETLVKN